MASKINAVGKVMGSQEVIYSVLAVAETQAERRLVPTSYPAK